MVYWLFVAMTILKLPYTVLISVIIGVTNMIPYFGPIIGCSSGAFILLCKSDEVPDLFIIMVLSYSSLTVRSSDLRSLENLPEFVQPTDFIFHHCRWRLFRSSPECSLEFRFCYSSILIETGVDYRLYKKNNVKKRSST